MQDRPDRSSASHKRTRNEPELDFRTAPASYRHWRIVIDAPIAELVLDVDEHAGIASDYVLKRNSYDIGVDIELADAVQRLRFEHPEVHAVVLRSGKPDVFCAGANIRMLAGASHGHKVNFCKFTNETRNAIEDASLHSGQVYLTAIAASAAGGGYELALATEHLLLIDDGNAAVSLPEVPLLAVLPGTGGLTRLTDKRKVRRDLADVFCTREEGVRGARALAWGLVDELAPRSSFAAAVRARAYALAALSDRPPQDAGIALAALVRERAADGGLHYAHLDVRIERDTATLCLHGPTAPLPADANEVRAQGAALWLLAALRAFDDALLYLRANAPDVGTLVLRTSGDPALVLQHDAWLRERAQLWWVREILLYAKRVLKRLDLTPRSLVAVIAPGSCFAGVLAELVFAADRSYMLAGRLQDDPAPAPTLTLSASNVGLLPMSNGCTRLQTRFAHRADVHAQFAACLDTPLLAARAEAAGLVTFAPDDVDWDDELRLFLEERAAFSADALSAMEANLRFAGIETMETRIFGRLSAWQNWVFQRPNAVGEEGSLARYGSGERPRFDRRRI